jgi:hypothetical protein
MLKIRKKKKTPKKGGRGDPPKGSRKYVRA